MSEGSHRNNPNTGLHVPFSVILLAVVAITCLTFGWKALVGFALLVLTACLASVTKRDLSRPISGDKIADAESSELENENLYYDDRGCCLKCGSEIFTVEIGVTTAEEIRRFASEAQGWRENPEAIEGWMPAGVYCPNGCFAIHVTPIPDFPRS